MDCFWGWLEVEGDFYSDMDLTRGLDFYQKKEAGPMHPFWGLSVHPLTFPTWGRVGCQSLSGRPHLLLPPPLEPIPGGIDVPLLPRGNFWDFLCSVPGGPWPQGPRPGVRCRRSPRARSPSRLRGRENGEAGSLAVVIASGVIRRIRMFGCSDVRIIDHIVKSPPRESVAQLSNQS